MISGWSSKASVGVERHRGRVLKARGGRRETTGKVLKDRRSPRRRGRMGTSVNMNAPAARVVLQRVRDGRPRELGLARRPVVVVVVVIEKRRRCGRYAVAFAFKNTRFTTRRRRRRAAAVAPRRRSKPRGAFGVDHAQRRTLRVVPYER
eukprot:31405-Pelagococcus_subviridis.AAC.12